jgi:hypothetical protein
MVARFALLPHRFGEGWKGHLMKKKKPYVKPAIIYRDVLKTRAGSIIPFGRPGSDPKRDPFDPANLFGKD